MNDDAKYREFEEALTDVLTEKEYILRRRSRLATAKGADTRPWPGRSAALDAPRSGWKWAGLTPSKTRAPSSHGLCSSGPCKSLALAFPPKGFEANVHVGDWGFHWFPLRGFCRIPVAESNLPRAAGTVFGRPKEAALAGRIKGAWDRSPRHCVRPA
jgi:hypothetical protein